MGTDPNVVNARVLTFSFLFECGLESLFCSIFMYPGPASVSQCAARALGGRPNTVKTEGRVSGVCGKVT